MMTLRRFEEGLESLPVTTAWYLGDLREALGKQELFTRQAPDRLRVLREHAIIESAVSSNRIEGVEIDADRVNAVVLGAPPYRDRNEEEVAGYRDALRRIHEGAAEHRVTEDAVRTLHGLCRGEIWDAGEYKERDGEIVETYPDGRRRVRFRPVPAAGTPAAMAELVDRWHRCLREQWVPPLLALAAFNLDFLCVHPFRDGNGRVSRLLLLLQWYHLGYEVGRYVSVERLIEGSKERYYETLEQSSVGWHEGEHDPWPYIHYLLSTLRAACREFEERVGRVRSPRGAKTEMVLRAIDGAVGSFRVADLRRECPAVSVDMIRHVLTRLRKEGRVEAVGRGPKAAWRKTERWELGNTQTTG